MKKSFYWAGTMIAVVILIVVALVGPGKKGGEEKVLARVGDEVVTVTDFKQQWRRNLSGMAGPPAGDPDEFLNDMIVERLFLSEARRRKIEEDPRFQEEMKNYREQLLVEALLNEEVLSVPRPAPAEIEDYWQEHQSEFAVPELVRVSHILIKPTSEQDEEKVQQRIQAVLERLEGGEDFADLARELSEGSSAPRGGDLGYFPPGRLVPELEPAAWSLETGQTAGPIKTQYGYHIIKVMDKKAPRDKTLEEARGEVIATLQASKRKGKFASLEAELRARTAIRIDQEILRQLKAELEKEL